MSWVWLTTLAAFTLGIALLWSFLAREHRRLTPIESTLLWSSETISGYWFVRFGLRHVIRGEPLSAGCGAGEFWIIVGTLTAGWLLDAGASVYRLHAEAQAHAKSEMVDAKVLDAERWVSGRRYMYRMRLGFTDDAGRNWVVEHVEGEEHIPDAVRTLMEAGQRPTTCPVRYDPGWPPRTWLPEQKPDGGQLRAVNDLTLLFQAAFILDLIVLGWGHWREVRMPGRIPFDQVAPFMASAGVLLLAGLAQLTEGSR